jgi:hypothetical protein
MCDTLGRATAAIAGLLGFFVDWNLERLRCVSPL